MTSSHGDMLSKKREIEFGKRASFCEGDLTIHGTFMFSGSQKAARCEKHPRKGK